MKHWYYGRLSTGSQISCHQTMTSGWTIKTSQSPLLTFPFKIKLSSTLESCQWRRHQPSPSHKGIAPVPVHGDLYDPLAGTVKCSRGVTLFDFLQSTVTTCHQASSLAIREKCKWWTILILSNSNTVCPISLNTPWEATLPHPDYPAFEALCSHRYILTFSKNSM